MLRQRTKNCNQAFSTRFWIIPSSFLFANLAILVFLGIDSMVYGMGGLANWRPKHFLLLSMLPYWCCAFPSWIKLSPKVSLQLLQLCPYYFFSPQKSLYFLLSKSSNRYILEELPNPSQNLICWRVVLGNSPSSKQIDCSSLLAISSRITDLC